jgi:DMSO reductase family type II enzyme chaperone
MSNDTVTHEIQLARARSAAYGLVSHGLGYPERGLIDTLRDPGRWTKWPEVLGRVDAETAGRLEGVRAALEVAEPTGLQSTYNAMFGHAVRGKAPPYELEYGWSEIVQQASSLADIAGFYAAFGMEMIPGANERPDHITAECEFMSVLCTKEAHAIEAATADNLAICKKAQAGFLKDHLACWTPAFAHRASQVDSKGFYGALTGFAAALVVGECRRFGLTVGAPTLPLRQADPVEDTSITCGPADCHSPGTAEDFVQVSVGQSGAPQGDQS